MTKRNRVEIPQSARALKAWFNEQPGDEIVVEIKAFVAKTGKPYLWRGHTHTKPPANPSSILMNFAYQNRFAVMKSFGHRAHAATMMSLGSWEQINSPLKLRGFPRKV